MPRKAAWRHSLTLNLLLLILIYKEEIPMSHFSTLRTKITDAEILKASLRDLGISVKTEADVRGYNGETARSAKR